MNMEVSSINQSVKFLNILGCNPRKIGSKSQFALFMLFVCGASVIVILIILLVVLAKEPMTVEEYTDHIQGASLFLYTVSKDIMMFTKRHEVLDMVLKIENYFWKIEDIRNEVHRRHYIAIMNRAAKIYYFLIFLFVFFVVSVFGIKSLPMECYVPTGVPLIVVIMFENCYCLLGVISVIGVDIMIMSMMVLTYIQFKMMNEEVKFLLSTEETDKSREEFIRKLKRLVDHHGFLLNFTELINQTFKGSLIIYIANIVGLMCLSMYSLSIMTEPTLQTLRDCFVLILSLYGFTICYCVPAQEFVDEAEKLKHSAYSTNWYDYPEYAPNILMIMVRDQLEVSISAGGIARINMETCLNVIRLAVSYYMFLRTMVSN